MAFSVSWTYKIIDQYTKPLDKIIAKTKEFTATISKTTSAANKLNSSLKKIDAKPFVKVQKILDKTHKTLNKSSKETKKIAKNFENLGSKLANFRTMSASALGVGFLTSTVKQSSEVETELINIKRVVNFSKKEFQQYRKEMLKLSYDLAILPKDIFHMSFLAGKMGVPKKELKDFTYLAGLTQKAFDMSGIEAGQRLSTVKSKLGLTIGATKEMLDDINKLADTTISKGSRIIKILERTYGTFNEIGMPKNLVAGWAAFADIISPTERLGASGLNMLIRRMIQMKGVGEELMNAPNKTLINYIHKFTQMDPLKASRLAYKEVGAEAGYFLTRAVSRFQALKKTVGMLARGGSVNSMIIEVNKQLKSTATALKKIRISLNILSIGLGQVLHPLLKKIEPVLTKIVLGFEHFIKKYPGLTKNLLVIIALGTALMALSVIIGVLIATLVGLSLAFRFMNPIVLVVSLLVSAFSLLYMNSKKVRTAFNNLMKTMPNVGILFKGLFSLVSTIGTIAFESLEWAVVQVLEALTSVIKFFSTNSPLNLIKQMQEAVFNLLDKAVDGISSFFGILGIDKELKMKKETSVSAAFAQNTSINGKIEVTASGGAKVKSASITPSPGGNLGLNMAY